MLALTIARASSVIDTLPDRDPRVQVWRDNDGTPRAYGCTLRGRHWVLLPNVGSFSFTKDTHEVIALAHPLASAELVLDAYCRCVLPLALQALGTEILHASGVVTDHGVVAFCAMSGTGKSTIAYGLSRRGYEVWADDAVAFDTSGPHVSTLSLPFEVRLAPTARSFFGQTTSEAQFRSPWRRQTQVQITSTPLLALCVLNRTPSLRSDVPVEARQLSPSQAFRAVLPHALCFSMQDTNRKRRMIERYLDLTSRIPIFEIRFRPGLDELSITLDQIENTVDSATTAS